jgi:tetratricopeptide (TPR) repeat protein
MYCALCVQWMNLLLLLAVTQAPAASTAPAADLAAQRQAVLTLLRADPAGALTAASEVFERWVRQEPDNRALRGFDDRLRALQALQQRICEAIEPAAREAARGLAADVLTDVVGAPATQPSRAAADVVPASQLYAEFLPQFLYRLDTQELDPPQQEFLRRYYNLQVRRMIDEVMRLGLPLSAMTADSHELEHYLLLLPLLHSTSGFDVSLLSTLPPWVLAPGRLEGLADFCLLRVGRLDAAMVIATRLCHEGKGDVYAYCVSAADKCEKNRQPGRAVQCLEAAVNALTKDDPRVLEQRFAICRTWANAKNYALAAGQAGRIIKDLAGTPQGGQARYLRIRYLSQQGDAKAVRMEVDDALGDEHCKPYEADLMFLKWSALRKEGKGEQAGAMLKEFVRKYPDDPQVAEMYYAVAVDCLSAQRYQEAQGILRSLMERFPASQVAARAKPLLTRLVQCDASANQPQAQSTQP